MPTIAVDPGGRCTGIAVRIGTRLAGHLPIHNPEPVETGAPLWAVPASPEIGYAETVWTAVAWMARAHRGTAQQWWRDREVEPGLDPWLVAVEKANVPRFVFNGDQMTPVKYAEMCGSVIAATGVANYVAGRYPGVQWVRPHGADTRWTKDPEGPWAWYPEDLLDGYPLIRPVSGWPPLDKVVTSDGRPSRIKDVAAAYAVAGDAATDYVQRCQKAHGTLLPPSQTNVVRLIHGSMYLALQERAGQAIPRATSVHGGAA
jgi:hypothetical protein